MSIVTLSFFSFKGLGAKAWAFTQMGIAPGGLRAVPGLTFYKFVGSGGRNGFSIVPNFGLYGLLCVWADEASAELFFANHPVIQRYIKKSTANQTIYLQACMAHGRWDGREPFEIRAVFDPQAPVAVLTRATIRWRYLPYFWSKVPAVSFDVAEKNGPVLAVGIGELPLVQQATFSIWQRGQDMMDFAYRRPLHQEAIRKTRALGWYKEELFARFVPVRVSGAGIFDFVLPDQ